MNQDIYVLIEHVQGKVAEISYIMIAAAREMAGATGGKVVGVLLGHGMESLAGDLSADTILYVEDPALKDFNAEAYQAVLTTLLREREPRALLLGSTTIGSDVAGGLSMRLGKPLVSQCQHVSAGEGSIKAVSKICGGKILAATELPAETTLLTCIPGGYTAEAGQGKPGGLEKLPASGLEDLRLSLIGYIEPETADVDISKEAILVAVGRGIQNEDNIELAEELADLLGGVVAASRPVVDQGWLGTSRLVGKSGKSVKAKLYLALGISGAPEHIEGVTGSETIIAVNSDPNAPIFDVATYGVNADLFDLIDPLIEQARAAKE